MMQGAMFDLPQRLVQFHMRLREHVDEPALLHACSEEADGGYLIAAVSRKVDTALAVVFAMPELARAHPGRGAFLGAAESIADGWNETLSVAMNCHPRRIQWAAVDPIGEGFAAVQQRGGRDWVALRDLARPGTAALREQLRQVFPDYGAFVLLQKRAVGSRAAVPPRRRRGLRSVARFFGGVRP